MAKKIVVLLGSPRKIGNSEKMADAFIEGAQSRGNTVKKIYTQDINAGCIGCGACYGTEAKPCAYNDEFNAVAPDLLEADGIVIAAPIYWYSFPGKMKLFLDNWFSFYCGEKPIGNKRAALLSCGEADQYNMFDGIQRSFELIAGILNWSIAGHVLVKGVLNPDDILEKEDELKKCRELGERF